MKRQLERKTEGSLFSYEQLRRLEEMQGQAPWIYAAEEEARASRPEWLECEERLWRSNEESKRRKEEKRQMMQRLERLEKENEALRRGNRRAPEESSRAPEESSRYNTPDEGVVDTEKREQEEEELKV